MKFKSVKRVERKIDREEETEAPENLFHELLFWSYQQHG